MFTNVVTSDLEKNLEGRPQSVIFPWAQCWISVALRLAAASKMFLSPGTCDSLT